MRVNPKDLARLMKQMGIESKEMDAERVIIELSNKRIVIEEPKVVKVKVGGEISFQISGNVKEEETMDEEAVKLVMEKANVNREKAISLLKKNDWDVAKAIMDAMRE